ncbi:MAG: hypothetical protein F2681_02885 [Actinobacteria bacterium]|nr:hypothetical protein [Actinomycetota bacterium]MSW76621.1 hypothetical protein [Actinomycetota bacterium]MSX91867.1 hypothetical protein [Actinomycetota bacterium]MSZ82068.1 hypothetical protein [Actinomycetota bacterium]MTB16907.1 hypothetical protein [Actinomycetota bacterium]
MAVAPIAHTSAVGPARPTWASDSPLQLISQVFDLDPAGTFSAVVGVPTEIDAATVVRATLVVTAYNRVSTPAAVSAALEGELPRAIDSVDLAVVGLGQPAAGRLEFAVPLESVTRTTAALQFPRPGLYPVVVELTVDGNVLADLLTFVHMLPSSTATNDAALPVAIAMATRSPVVLDDNTDVVIDPETTAEFTQLADLLESTPLPVTLRIPPALLTAVAANGNDGAALALRLSTALADRTLISAPSVPLDPSAAAADSQQSLYTQWLRDGEDVLTGVAGVPPVRTVVLGDQPISTTGGALERDLGARLMVLPPDRYDALTGGAGALTDPSQLVQVAVGPNITLPATVVDRVVAEELASTSAEPALIAIYTVTHLLAVRQQIVDGGGDPSRHGVTIATTDLGLPDTATFAALAGLLDTTHGLQPVTLDELGVHTATQSDKGGPVTVSLPDSITGSISTRTSTMSSLQREANSTGGMLADGAGRTADWNRVIGLLPTSAITDAQVDMLSASLRADFASIRNAVEMPTGFSFNLTSRSGMVRVKVLNDSNSPLSVQIRISSPKLVPQAPQVVTLEPGEYNEIKLRIVARSNGDIPATLEIFTPDGNIRLGPAVPLTASVKALSGLGNLVTGALLLVLLTWWARHLRQHRRAQAALRHPVGAGRAPENLTTDSDVTTETPALSPDAQASTLPPS